MERKQGTLVQQGWLFSPSVRSLLQGLGTRRGPANCGHHLTKSALVVAKTMSEQMQEAQECPRLPQQHRSELGPALPRRGFPCPNSSHELECGLRPPKMSAQTGMEDKILASTPGKGYRQAEGALRRSNILSLTTWDRPPLI